MKRDDGRAKGDGRGFAFVWASGLALALALASCVLDVSLGAGPGGTSGGCDDGNSPLGSECGGTIKSCRLPMDARPVGTCTQSLGFAWDGRQCVELRGCACLGSRCGSLYDTLPGCQIDKMHCDTPDPEPEICGDGVDNNGNMLVDEGCPVPCPAVAQDMATSAPPGCVEPKVLGFAWNGEECIEVKGCACVDPSCPGLAPDLATCKTSTGQCLPSDCVPPAPMPTPEGTPIGQPKADYQLFDPEKCAQLGPLPCGPNGTPFSNRCGCGCITLPAPDPNEPFAIYLYASHDVTECKVRDIVCKSGDFPQVGNFADAGGCGCLYNTECPAPDAPGVELRGKDPKICGALDLGCKPYEQIAFRGACGCGCMPAPKALCSMPPEAYASADAYTCSLKQLSCPPNERPFRDFCGCGCVPVEQQDGCPKKGEPGVDYLGEMPDAFAICDLLSFQCEADQESFSIPGCGCGCRLKVEPQPGPDPAPPPSP